MNIHTKRLVVGMLIVSSLSLPFGVVEAKVVKAKPIPAGVTAVCKDGTYSYSAHRRGTCSHHKGVRTWL